MAYKDINELVKDVEKFHPIYLCESLSNFLGLCRQIKKALKDADFKTATDEMHRLTHLYQYATHIRYDWAKDGQRFNRNFIEADFQVAKEEIEEYFCNNFVTGNFEITIDILNKHWDMVDWDAYYNESNRRFIDACKKANEIVGYTGDKECSEYYAEDKKRFGFEEIFYSHYNGGRVRASFKNETDCLLWSFHSEAIKEDGLFWGEQPAY